MTTEPVALSRVALAGGGVVPAPPVRIVHLGLGAFHRAHQAWYTAHARDAEDWGIAAFTGRDPLAADRLLRQDGLYTVVEQGPDGDRVEVVTSLVEAWDGARLDRLAELLADPAVVIVTLTITEAGYRLGPDGTADLTDPVVVEDLRRLREAHDAGRDLATAAPRGTLTRLLVGLEARRLGGGAPLAVVPCDNVPRNGSWTRTGLLSLAAEVSADLAGWVEEAVGFISTSVDRITPRLADLDVPAVRAAGWVDAAPVVTEPFHDWILAGTFPVDHPDWGSAGARFVEEIEAWENRKLWLLNGAHSVLAYDGIVRGHATVAEAVADPACRALVEDFWAAAVTRLPADSEHADYRRALLARFGNRRIVHPLAQIAEEGTSKVRFRLAAVTELLLADGETADAGIAAIATWVRWAVTGHQAGDARWSEVAAALASEDPVAALLALVSPTLADDADVVDRLRRATGTGTDAGTGTGTG